MKYQAIFSGDTNSDQKLGEKGVFVVSLLLNEESIDPQDKQDKFEAGLNRMAIATPDLTFLATGVLNRYNYEILGFDPIQAKENSLKDYTFWDTKYALKVKAMPNLKNSLNWHEIIESEDFSSCSQCIKNLYENHNPFKMKVIGVVSSRLNFLASETGKKRNPSSINFEPGIALQKSTEYVLEECAMVLYLRKSGFDSLFYLGKVNSATEYMAELVNEDTRVLRCNPMKLYGISQYKVLRQTKADRSANLIPSVSNAASSPNNRISFNEEPNLLSLAQPGTQNLEALKVLAQSFFGSNVPPELKAKIFLKLSIFHASGTQNTSENNNEESTLNPVVA